MSHPSQQFGCRPGLRSRNPLSLRMKAMGMENPTFAVTPSLCTRDLAICRRGESEVESAGRGGSDRFPIPKMRLYRDQTETHSKDYSGIGILLGNVLAVGWALKAGWNLREMMGIYWVQSVIIGLFNFFRMLLLRSFSTDGFTSNGKPVPENAQGKISTAIFFAFHYGIFHLVYLTFLAGFSESGEKPFWESGGFHWFLLSVLGFLLGHGYSFYENVRADLERRPNLGTMMFLPYARIIPMHLAIIFGSQVGGGLFPFLLFSGLKTAADYLMHIVEHRVLQRKPAEKAVGFTARRQRGGRGRSS